MIASVVSASHELATRGVTPLSLQLQQGNTHTGRMIGRQFGKPCDGIINMPRWNDDVLGWIAR